MVRLEHQKQLAQRIRRRRPARWKALEEPRRTLEAVCFLRVTLLQKTDVLIALIDREILKFRRQTVEKVRTANMALGVSLRKQVRQLQSYAREEGRTLEELRQGIAELLPDSPSVDFASQAAEIRYPFDASCYASLIAGKRRIDPCVPFTTETSRQRAVAGAKNSPPYPVRWLC